MIYEIEVPTRICAFAVKHITAVFLVDNNVEIILKDDRRHVFSFEAEEEAKMHYQEICHRMRL